MKAKIMAVGVAAVVVAAVVLVFVYGIGASPYWETDSEFGAWQDELIIEFADGTTESLKLIQTGEGKPFTVTYFGSEITGVKIRLSASVAGEGYASADLRTTGFGYDGSIRPMGDVTAIHQWSSVSTENYNIAVGDTLILSETGIDLDVEINDQPWKYPTDTYVVSFGPKGTVEFRGSPDGDWQTASLPPDRFIAINVDSEPGAPPGQIMVTLSSEITTE